MGFFSKLLGIDPEVQKNRKFVEFEKQYKGDEINYMKASWLTARGKGLVSSGNTEQAINDFNDAIKIDANHLMAFIGLSLAHCARCDGKRALEVLQSAPSNGGRNDFTILFYMIPIYIGLGDKEMALNTAEKALEAAELPARREDQELLKLSNTIPHAAQDEDRVREIKGLISELKGNKNLQRDNDLTQPINDTLNIGDDSFQKNVEWYKNEAEQGDSTAQYVLGEMYANGHGVPKDLVKAFDLFKKSAEQGDVNAQTSLGAMYYKGEVVPKDLAKAVEWHQKAAEQGDAFAQFILGSMYHTGKGVQKDYITATKWLKKAAEQGNAEAQFFLGNMYYNGMGLPKDSANAVIWWEKAAVQGDAASQSALGSSYYQGEGVSKDLVLAYAWFSLSAIQDSEYQEKAMANCAVIEKELSTTEITEAKALLSRWKVGMILKRTGK